MKNKKCECQKIEVKFDDLSEIIRLALADKSENVKVEMAPVGNTLINTRVEVLKGTCSYWNNQQYLISRKNVLYLYTDYKSHTDPETGEIMYNPGLKIGDGLAYLIDLPFIGGYQVDITQGMIDFWNGKWRGYIDPNASENLVFTIN